MSDRDDLQGKLVLDRRQRANVRLAWACGGIALALFALAIWKYRPL